MAKATAVTDLPVNPQPSPEAHKGLDSGLQGGGVLRIEMWPIDRPKPYARNARKLSAVAVDKVAASLTEFGWQQPLVVDRDGVLIVGHTRLLAAKKLGMTEVPVHVAAHLTEAQVKAYRLMDNRSHQETEWDFEILSPELLDLKAMNFGLMLTGFDVTELDRFLNAVPDVEFKEYDESAADDVEFIECPECKHKFPK